MNATATFRYAVTGHAPAPARTTIPHGTANALRLIAAPFIGLAFVVAGPFVAAAILAGFLLHALRARRAALLRAMTRVALFGLAPVVGLVYLLTFPLAALALLGWHAVRRQ